METNPTTTDLYTALGSIIKELGLLGYYWSFKFKKGTICAIEAQIPTAEAAFEIYDIAEETFKCTGFIYKFYELESGDKKGKLDFNIVYCGINFDIEFYSFDYKELPLEVEYA